MPIPEPVLKSLEGFSERQAARDAARENMRRLKLVQKARREGHMATFEEATKTLAELEMPWLFTVEAYGIRVLTTAVGVILAFDRTGKLSWSSRPKPAGIQESFTFEDDPCDESFPFESDEPHSEQSQ